MAEVHVVATGGECKDLLLILTREALQQGGTTPTLYAHEGEERNFRFTLEEETTATPPLCYAVGAIPLRARSCRAESRRF